MTDIIPSEATTSLTTRIVSEHWTTMHNGFHCVGCDWRGNGPDEDYGRATRRHVAEVVERELREQIAGDIESLLDNSEGDDMVLECAKIARGFAA